MNYVYIYIFIYIHVCVCGLYVYNYVLHTYMISTYKVCCHTYDAISEARTQQLGNLLDGQMLSSDVMFMF